MEPRKKVHPNVLKVPEDRIKEKQLRKANLEQSKESRNLYEYIQKLNHIENKRVNFRLFSIADRTVSRKHSKRV